MTFLPLLLTSFVYSVSSYSIAFFNACPTASVGLRYGTTSSSYPSDTRGLTTGTSAKISVSYSPVYYQIYDNVTNALIASSSLTITNANINGIGYVNYQTYGCQPFVYAPIDTSLASKSVVVFINGATVDKDAYIGNSYIDSVSSSFGSYYEVTDSTEIEYSNTYVKFCSGTDCATSVQGSANIPIGSALFIINYLISSTGTIGSVNFATTGSTSLSFDCSGCDIDLDFDDDDVPARVVAAAVLGALFGICFLCCGIAYLVHLCKKKNQENAPLNNIEKEGS